MCAVRLEWRVRLVIVKSQRKKTHINKAREREREWERKWATVIVNRSQISSNISKVLEKCSIYRKTQTTNLVCSFHKFLIVNCPRFDGVSMQAYKCRVILIFVEEKNQNSIQWRFTLYFKNTRTRKIHRPWHCDLNLLTTAHQFHKYNINSYA